MTSNVSEPRLWKDTLENHKSLFCISPRSRGIKLKAKPKGRNLKLSTREKCTICFHFQNPFLSFS